MKKIICLMLSIFMLTSITAGLELSASAQTNDGFKYTLLDDGTVEITGYTGSEEELFIPSVIDGYTVTGIGDYAFYNCNSLTSVTIPNSVIYIGNCAFSFNSLISVSIPDTVTNIGDRAFEHCSKLTKITIPDSVINIGDSAFFGCYALRSINVDKNNPSYSSTDGVLFNKEKTVLLKCPAGDTQITYIIPESVTTIGDYAFSDCNDLTAVTIPDSVTYIGNCAFYDCNSLILVTIPDAVTSIGNSVCYSCENLTKINVGVNNPNYSSKDGVLFNKNKTELILYPQGKNQSEYRIPDSVEKIKASAFEWVEKLCSIKLSENLQIIEDRAFYGCTNLREMLLPNSLIDIGEETFGQCQSLLCVTIPGSIENIGDSAFSGCNNLTSVSFEEGVCSIGTYAFSYCENLANIIIPLSLRTIEDYAFDSCSNIELVDYAGTEDEWDDIDVSSYFNYYLTNANIHYNSEPEHYELLETVGPTCTENGYNFYKCNCGYEKKTPIAATGHDFENNICINCAQTYEVILNGESKLCDSQSCCFVFTPEVSGNYILKVGNSYFNNNFKITIYNNFMERLFSSSYDLRQSITYYFEAGNTYVLEYDCSNFIDENSYLSINKTCDHNYVLESFVSPVCGGKEGYYEYICLICGNKITSNLHLEHCFIQGICINCDIEETNKDFTYSLLEDGTAQIDGYIGTEEELVIPSRVAGYTVTSIGNSAFSDCYSLTDVIIPNSVTNIGSFAFSYCYSLTDITIPEAVTNIGNSAFFSCDSLTEIIIPANVISIGDMAFGYCTSLKNINVDVNNPVYSSVDGVLLIKDKTELIQYPIGNEQTAYVIPNTVTSIGKFAFESCNSLIDITIPDSVTSIGKRAFRHCGSLTEITIPDSVTSIGDYAFEGCYSLTEITIPDSVTSIEDYAFESCSSLTEITIPDSVTSIGDYVFDWCDSLTEITIPDSVTSIGDYAFSYCTSLTDVYYGGTEQEWNGITCGWGNAYLLNATVHFETESTPAESAFEYVVLEDGTAQITDYTGSETELVIPSEIDGHTVTSLRESALYHSPSLVSVSIPETVTDIGYKAFGHCMNLTDINVADGNENYCSVDGVLFSKDKKMIVSYPAGKTQTAYSIPEGVENISSYAFRDNEYLESITIPDGVTSIGTSAFESCTSLADISFPESVVSVGVDAVYNTAYFKDDSNWVDSVLYVDHVLIMALDSIHGKYEIKDGTTVIVGSAFDNCNYLTEIVIPDSVTNIPGGMFVSCKGLQSVTIPETVTEIGAFAFDGCSVLTDVYFEGSETQWNRISVATGNEVLNNITVHFGKESLLEVEDGESGVTVAEDALEVLPGNTELVVEKVSETTTGVSYNISLQKNGEEIQPNGTVTVKIPVPEGMDGNACKVYRQESDGSYTDMNAVYQDGYMVFTTDHFSRYILTTAELGESEILYGDANGDGSIDMKDVVLLRKYMANYNYDTESSSEVVEPGADANGDGSIDMKDVVLLRKYLANYDYDTNSSSVVLGPQ